MIQITFVRGRILICGWRCLSKMNKFHNVPYLNLVCFINDQLQYTRKSDFQWDSSKHPGQQWLSWMPFVHRLKFFTSRLYLTDAAALWLTATSVKCEWISPCAIFEPDLFQRYQNRQRTRKIDWSVPRGIFLCRKINIINSLRPSNICIHKLGILWSL